MGRLIAYDVMRIFIGPAFLTPRGIDRIELALARFIFDKDSSHNVGILPTPAGVYCLRAAQVRVLLTYIERLWAEDTDETRDFQLKLLIGKIASQSDRSAAVTPVRSLMFRDKVRRMLAMLFATRIVPRHLASRSVPANAVYLNTGQLGLAMPSFFDWLDKRPDVTRAMMVHDVIPIDHPHLVRAGSPVHHHQMIRTAAERADCMIFNSTYTQSSVTAAMQSIGLPCPPALVRSLPLPAAFASVAAAPADLSDTRYFMAVSTVEPRKNHALLLRVWQRLLQSMADAAPHLVIVGAPGKDAEAILAPLQADAALRTRVHHVVGLSSPALASLVLGAAGMLCPSFAEGFGLPLLEASALQVPTIASNIPPHREVATAATTLLPSDDDDAWARAIAALPKGGMRPRPPIPLAMTEAAYCADIVDFISSVGRRTA